MWHLIHFYIHIRTLSESKAGSPGWGNAHRLSASYSDCSLEGLVPSLCNSETVVPTHCLPCPWCLGFSEVFWAPVCPPSPPPSKTARAFYDSLLDLGRSCSVLILPFYQIQNWNPGMARHACNHNTQEAKTGGFQILSQPEPCNKTVSEAGSMRYEQFPNTVKQSVLVLLPSWQ